MSYLTSEKSRQLALEYDQVSSRTLILNAQLEDILEARLGLLTWAAEPSEEARQYFLDNIEEVLTDGDRFVNLPMIPEKEQSLGYEIMDVVVSIREKFGIIYDLQAKRNVEVAQLDKLGPKIVADLATVAGSAYADQDVEAAYRAGSVSTAVNFARLVGQKFLLRNSPEDAKSTLAALDDALEKLSVLRSELQNPSRRQLTAQLVDEIGKYKQHFSNVAALIEERNGYLDGLISLKTDELDILEQTLDAQLIELTDLVATSRALTEVNQQNTIIAFGVALVLAIISTIVLVRVTNKPLKTLAARMEAVAKGEVDFRVREENGKDEWGRMWDALAALRSTAETAFARAQMIEQLPTPVVLTNPKEDFAITYMNTAATNALRDAKADTDAGFVEVFKFDGENRAHMDDPRHMPIRSRVDLSDSDVIDLTVSPVENASGEYEAAMATWRNITHEVRSASSFETNVKGTIDQIATTFQGMRVRIDGISDRLSGTKGRLTEGSSAVVQATENVELVAGAAEELSASIAEIASRLNSSAREAASAAETTTDVAKRAEELEDASNRITQVIEAIADITNKTKLLALNATIEAASAGDAGKGFAVVAAEVKSLAEQTARATEEIDSQIRAVQGRIGSVVNGVVQVSETIRGLNEVFASAASAAEQQQAATHEITENAKSASGGARTAAEIINEVEDSANSDLEATQALSDDAKELAQANDNLSQQSTNFLVALASG
ncbi:MAG: methyl-accepting chemotaxis protein [Pseudomonadota bacterium]